MKARFTVPGLVVLAQIAEAGALVGQGHQTAAQAPPTAPGTVDGYAIVADSTSGIAFSWNGSDNIVSGPVASAGGIVVNGQRNQFHDPVTYAATMTTYGSTTFAVPPVSSHAGCALEVDR